jgi:hypothetical protein
MPVILVLLHGMRHHCDMRAFDFPYETVEINCSVCGRFGRYSKQRFIELVGANTSLPTALDVISKDCPEDRPSVTNMQGRCRASYPQLAQMNATKPKAPS